MAFFLSRKAPAKLNLGLHVLRKRDDGFHDLETVFVLIDWSDTVSVEPADRISFSVDDPELDGEGDNLCLRAARLLQDECGLSDGAHIDLEKCIPMGAGLGGGSSDAALTLQLLNELWDTGLDDTRLRTLGAMLGSDVPVFLHPTPAYATGRGELLSPLTTESENDLLEIPFWFTVIKPNVHVSTAEAYSVIRPNDRNRPDLRDIVLSLDLDRWSKELTNDFEAPIVERHPEIGKALEILLGNGAGYAAMSGSGSAVFGVYPSESRAAEAATVGVGQGLSSWYGKAYQPIRPF